MDGNTDVGSTGEAVSALPEGPAQEAAGAQRTSPGHGIAPLPPAAYLVSLVYEVDSDSATTALIDALAAIEPKPYMRLVRSEVR